MANIYSPKQLKKVALKAGMSEAKQREFVAKMLELGSGQSQISGGFGDARARFVKVGKMTSFIKGLGKDEINRLETACENVLEKERKNPIRAFFGYAAKAESLARSVKDYAAAVKL